MSIDSNFLFSTTRHRFRWRAEVEYVDGSGKVVLLSAGSWRWRERSARRDLHEMLDMVRELAWNADDDLSDEGDESQ